MKNEYLEFIDCFGRERVLTNVSLAEQTTFHLGGPADLFLIVRTPEEMAAVLKTAHKLNIDYFLLGAGANVLVSDEGFRGLVIKSGIKDMKILGKTPAVKDNWHSFRTNSARNVEHHHRQGLLKLSDLDEEGAARDTMVSVGSGVSLPHLLRWSLENGLTGLELFSGIPATVGGAIFNNIHGGTRLIVPLLVEVELIGRDFQIRAEPPSYLKAAYDWTTLHQTKEVITKATFLLSSKGNVQRASEVAREWQNRKLAVQPQTNTPGCVFRNISEEDQARLNWPTRSIGYLFDQLIPYKGTKKIGGACVSEQHPNFIVNDGTATSQDVVSLINDMREVAKSRYNLELLPEIIFVGFKGNPLK